MRLLRAVEVLAPQSGNGRREGDGNGPSTAWFAFTVVDGKDGVSSGFRSNLPTLKTGRRETRGQGLSVAAAGSEWGIRPNIKGRKRYEALISDPRTPAARLAWQRDHRTSP